jgi:hypothetical protein
VRGGEVNALLPRERGLSWRFVDEIGATVLLGLIGKFQPRACHVDPNGLELKISGTRSHITFRG